MAKAATLELTVITPERQVVATQTDSVVIPAHDGELGILRDRAPLMCELGVGALRYQDGGRTRRVMIDGGFAQVANNKVTVLTERAVMAEEITPELLADAEKQAALPATTPDEREAAGRARRRVATLRALKSA